MSETECCLYFNEKMEWWRLVRVPKSAPLLLFTALTFLLSSLPGFWDLRIQRGRGSLYASKGWKCFSTCYTQRTRARGEGAKGVCSVLLELPSPEPGSKTRAWLWGLVEGRLPLSYFFPLSPHEPHPLMLPKSPPLAFHGVCCLIQETGVECPG